MGKTRPLTDAEWEVLRALKVGKVLKSHRYLDGRKVYQVHGFNGDVEGDVSLHEVEHLKDRGLIESNMKFPAATYLLTDVGARWVSAGDAAGAEPLRARLPQPPMPE